MKQFIIFFFSITLLIFNANTAAAQSTENQLGGWLMYFGGHSLGEKWILHSELQIRERNFKGRHEQVLSRIGLLRKVNPNLTLGGGYGFITNYVGEEDIFSPFTVEHRIWQQMIGITPVSRVRVEHRLRLEQRWLDGDYSNRFRYRLMASVPLNQETLSKGAIAFHVYDEIFLNITDNPFDRNRLYGAVGYHFSNSHQIQAGYLRQSLSNFYGDYLQLAILITK